MAAHALVGCVVVVSFVAGETIILDRQMCPIDQPVVVVNIECSRSPTGRGGVTAFAIPWQVETCMRRIDG